VDAVHSVVCLLVDAEAKPIPPVGQSLPDIFRVFPLLRNLAPATATCKCALSATPHYLPGLAMDHRPRFSGAFIAFRSGFVTENPRLHKEFIVDMVLAREAQSVTLIRHSTGEELLGSGRPRDLLNWQSRHSLR
jgi:hypothetical protein